MPKWLQWLGHWLWYIISDANDEPDLTLWMWFAAVVIFLYKAAIAPPPFDFLNFGVGAAGVFGAGKALDWFTHRKDKTERDNDARVQHD